jgi:hypothetical protein
MKTPKAKTPKTKKGTRSPARQIAQTSIRRAQDYVVPGSLVLGTGLATAAGIVFRKQLSAMGSLAAEVAGRRSAQPPAFRIVKAGFGALGGLVVGSALALWFAHGGPRGAHARLRTPLHGVSEKATAEPRTNSVGRTPSNHV